MKAERKRGRLLVCTGVGLCLAVPGVAFADVHFNGFGQVVVGSSLDNNRHMDRRTNIGDYSADPDFSSESLFGLQAQSALSNDLSATAQIVADGAQNNFTSSDPTHVCLEDDTSCSYTHDDFTPKFTWAYVSYQMNDDWSIKAGRQRLPLYHYSDYLQVGEAYPWVRPPVSVYNSPVANYDGVSLNGNISVGDWYFAPEVFFGEYDGTIYNQETQVPNSKLSNLAGVVFDATYNDWLEFRASYTEAKLSVDYPLIDQLGAGLTQVAQGACYSPTAPVQTACGLYGVGAAAAGAAGTAESVAKSEAASGDYADAAVDGANAQLLLDAYQNYARASQDLTGVANDLNVDHQLLQYMSGGLEINKYNFILDAEYAYQHSPKFIPNVIAYYASLGYKMGNFTPMVTFGRSELKSPDPALADRLTGGANDANEQIGAAAGAVMFVNGLPAAPGAAGNLYTGDYGKYAGIYNTGKNCTATPSQCLPTFDQNDINPADQATTAAPQYLAYGAGQAAYNTGYVIANQRAVDDYYEFGLRYDVTRNTALKLDYTYYASPVNPASAPVQGYLHSQLLSAAFTFTF